MQNREAIRIDYDRYLVRIAADKGRVNVAYVHREQYNPNHSQAGHFFWLCNYHTQTDCACVKAVQDVRRQAFIEDPE